MDNSLKKTEDHPVFGELWTGFNIDFTKMIPQQVSDEVLNYI